MGVYVDYTLRAEGTDEELRERLERVRQRCLDLPFHAVAEVRRVEPVYNRVFLLLYEQAGYTLPPAVRRRVDAAEADTEQADLAMAFGLSMPTTLDPLDQFRCLGPAMDLVFSTDLWNREEIPA